MGSLPRIQAHDNFRSSRRRVTRNRLVHARGQARLLRRAVLVSVACVLVLDAPLAQDRDAAAPRNPSAPLVVGAEVPFYPPVALSARLEGDVRLSVRVSKGIISAVALVQSDAHRALQVAATTNVRTWRFGEDATGVIEMLYQYRLAEEESDTVKNDYIEMELPTVITIVGTPVKATCHDCPPASIHNRQAAPRK